MSKKQVQKKKVDKGELKEPTSVSEPAKVEEKKVLPKREITDETIVAAIKELGGKANLGQVRKQLGQPATPTENLEKLESWPNYVIRNKARALVEAGKLKEDKTTRISTYTVA